jgi:hypothetical protein
MKRRSCFHYTAHAAKELTSQREVLRLYNTRQSEKNLNVLGDAMKRRNQGARGLTPAEYEDYVEAVLRELNWWKNACVFRNRRYPGLRQPGEYEIDIAFEVKLSEVIFFRVIIECKNWKRPVTRPVVQNLAQTRDAIGAHKAAIASPVGFSDEAIQVARAHGIALWILTDEMTAICLLESRSKRQLLTSFS